jgi:nitroreductase
MSNDEFHGAQFPLNFLSSRTHTPHTATRMNALTPDALVGQLRWRYATKQFDSSRKIPADVWAALEQSLVLSPSSFGLQPWKFIIVTSQTVKQSFVPVSWNQTQPADCSHHVVFTVRKNLTEADVDRFIQSIADTRGVAVESQRGYRDVMVGFAANLAKQGQVREWATRQVYIALGNFMTCCATLGVDTCPMEGIVPAEYDKLLGLEGGDFTTVVACAAGYRAAADKYASLPKVRFSASEVIQRA